MLVALEEEGVEVVEPEVVLQATYPTRKVHSFL